MITRQQAWELLTSHMQNQNLLRHCLAVEAVMKALARYFMEKEKPVSAKGYDEVKWGIVGLLHDGDYEEVKKDPSQHTLKMYQWLKDKGENDEEILSAILSHNFAHTGNNPSVSHGASAPKNNLEWSLYCCDELTGLIVAVTLVRPDKKLSSVTVDSVLKKWDVKGFAAGVNRKQIEDCEEKLGIKLPDFINISLAAMQAISADLGL